MYCKENDFSKQFYIIKTFLVIVIDDLPESNAKFMYVHSSCKSVTKFLIELFQPFQPHCTVEQKNQSLISASGEAAKLRKFEVTTRLLN